MEEKKVEEIIAEITKLACYLNCSGCETVRATSYICQIKDDTEHWIPVCDECGEKMKRAANQGSTLTSYGKFPDTSAQAYLCIEDDCNNWASTWVRGESCSLSGSTEWVALCQPCKEADRIRSWRNHPDTATLLEEDAINDLAASTAAELEEDRLRRELHGDRY